jgi:hypothetical protein
MMDHIKEFYELKLYETLYEIAKQQDYPTFVSMLNDLNNSFKGQFPYLKGDEKMPVNDCAEECYTGGSGGGGAQVEQTVEYDEIILRLERAVAANKSGIDALWCTIATVLNDEDRKDSCCAEVTMSQTLNRLIEQIDINNKMLDKALEKTKQSVGNLKLFTD